jgi:hypothetical protein
MAPEPDAGQDKLDKNPAPHQAGQLNAAGCTGGKKEFTRKTGGRLSDAEFAEGLQQLVGLASKLTGMRPKTFQRLAGSLEPAEREDCTTQIEAAIEALQAWLALLKGGQR